MAQYVGGISDFRHKVYYRLEMKVIVDIHHL